MHASPKTDFVPAHTVYCGAHLFTRDTYRKLGRAALAMLDGSDIDGPALASIVGAASGSGEQLLTQVRSKLSATAVEDLRIDFEDGYGARSAQAEDADAARVAEELAAAVASGNAAAGMGLRIKALSTEATRARALRTLTLFIAKWAELQPQLLKATKLRITLPKVERTAEVALLTDTLSALCTHHKLPIANFEIELMFESPAALLTADGRVAVRALVDAANGLCASVHFGAYDYLSALGVDAASQSLHHAYCHDARITMQKALYGTAVRVVDGATTQLPILPHKSPTTTEHIAENNRALRDALMTHAWDVSVSLAHGIHQSWDLHPGQLISRWAATYAHYTENRDGVVARLRAFLHAGQRAAAAGQAFDDAATVRGLAAFVSRGLRCGALAPDALGELQLSEQGLNILAKTGIL
jgi:hypothetical protein